MRHPVVKTTGLFLVSLVIVGLVLTVLHAAISGQPFYGVNYKGLPLGTYSTLACLALAGAIGLVAGTCGFLLSRDESQLRPSVYKRGEFPAGCCWQEKTHSRR